MDKLEALISDMVRRALEEDASSGDVTTRLLVDRHLIGSARIVAREPGVVSGHVPAGAVFGQIDEKIVYEPVTGDGGRITPGGDVALISGRVSAILAAERTALNFLQHLSGVATATAAFVERLGGSGPTVLDTRKTVPQLRLLEKIAVVDGGGANHRMNLEEMILVKENHITAAGGLAAVVGKLGRERLAMAEIEVTSIDELRVLKDSPPMRVMLDNFSPGEVIAALGELEGWDPMPEVEVSGGISLDNIGEFAIDGVDYISVGSITSSPHSLDMSLILERG